MNRKLSDCSLASKRAFAAWTGRNNIGDENAQRPSCVPDPLNDKFSLIIVYVSG